MRETNVFELITFELLDGVILAPVTFAGDLSIIDNNILVRLQNECSKPVVSVDMPLGDYPVVYTDDRSDFSSITAHVIDVHGCRKIYFLSGTEGFAVSEQRLAGFKDMMEKRDIPLDDSMIFNGDFWYSGGEALADRIVSGELPMPEAVICASDHMAIGLANRLVKGGIKVPEQVIVTGYDGTYEAVINDITITTCIPDNGTAAAEAVNVLRRRIEPDKEVIPVSHHRDRGLRLCSSCGCPENMAYIKERLNDSLIRTNRNYGENGAADDVDINTLLESYMFENFAGSADVDDCLDKILWSDYLIRPYYRFYLCLKEEWRSEEEQYVKG